jgi:hypothetical protein
VLYVTTKIGAVANFNTPASLTYGWQWDTLNLDSFQSYRWNTLWIEDSLSNFIFSPHTKVIFIDATSASWIEFCALFRNFPEFKSGLEDWVYQGGKLIVHSFIFQGDIGGKDFSYQSPEIFKKATFVNYPKEWILYPQFSDSDHYLWYLLPGVDFRNELFLMTTLRDSGHPIMRDSYDLSGSTDIYLSEYQHGKGTAIFGALNFYDALSGSSEPFYSIHRNIHGYFLRM